jgi:hypothetical protein
MREDRFSNSEHDAGLYESRRGQADDVDPRPTLAEAERDECECFWTGPSTWTYCMGHAEPGSQMEQNPECPVHPAYDPVERNAQAKEDAAIDEADA